MIKITIALILTVLMALYFWMKHRHSYWRRMNVPYIKPNPIFGNFKEMLTMSCNTAKQFQILYNHKETKDEPIMGIYIMNRAGLLIRDLDLIKSILVKDFNKFCNRSATTNQHGDILGSNNLLTIKNPEWRQLRTMLSPAFTSTKLKQMFPLVNEIGIGLSQYCSDLPFDPETNSCIAEMREISALYTTDAISLVAFGIQANTLQNCKGDFRQKGKHITDCNTMRTVDYYSIIFLPLFARILRCKVFPEVTSKFLRKTLSFVIEERMRSGRKRNDLIDLLIAFKKSAEADEDKKHLARNDILIAQAAIFFAAGYDTASAAISFAMYELSKNPEIQKRLREEIREALIKNDGKVTYEMLNDMEYLEMVINEVLRLYPSTPLIDRECTLAEDDKKYSLKPYSDYKIPNKMPIYISIYAIHRDPKHYPNPEKFDPERFSSKNKENIMPMSFLPFGSGPHGCIGKRLGYIMMKVGLIHFLKNHYVSTCEKSHEQMVFEPKAFLIQPKNGIYCSVVRDPLI